jgi:hypothetical protein
MKITLLTVILLLLSNILFGQSIMSGDYDIGLKLAYDKNLNKLTGYYENFTGYDEESDRPKFSCIFYITGTISDSQFTVETYFPNDSSDLIVGNIHIIDQNNLIIKLPEEHGGCWNVQHFADEQVKYTLQKSFDWIQIRFVTKNKSYFYLDKHIDTKQKTYLVKNDFVCIEKIDGDWAYCTFYGLKTKKGWIRIADLNKI